MESLSPLLLATRSALQSGAPDIERLYELGKKRQWNAADLEWDSLDFSAIPSELRSGLSDLLAQTHYGELGALTASARLVQRSGNLVDRLFGATQVTDEARHVEWFSRLLFHLDTPTPPVPSVAAFIDGVIHTDDDLALLVGMNILIEGLAQTLMLEAGRVLRQASGQEFRSLAVIGTWLVERIAHDESRHLAFGVTRVHQLVSTLDMLQRNKLERQIGVWARDLLKITEDRCDGVVAFGLDGDALMARCVEDTRSRLALAGLSLEA